MHRFAPALALLAAAACAAAPIAQAPQPGPLEARFVARKQAMQAMAENFERVHFEFDSSAITLETREALFANTEIMRAFPEIALEVEGHCDEVGSVEYNLALGQRRADAIQKYMVAAGIPKSSVATISYGKALPLDLIRDAPGFAFNRRAEFRLSYTPHPNLQGSIAGLETSPVVVAQQD